MVAPNRLWTSFGDISRLRTGSWSAPARSTESAHLFDACGQLLHQVVHRAVLADQTRDLGRGVDDGGVVAAAEFLADLRERRVGQLAREVHRDLARVDDVMRALVAA